jgi:IclR family transcriptional regulator, KDG regulon repressor
MSARIKTLKPRSSSAARMTSKQPAARASSNQEAAKSGGSVQAVQTALHLLETVAEHEGFGMSELAARAGLTHNQTHRLLATLEGSGYVSREADRSYHLGPKIALLGRSEGRYRELLRAAAQPMDALSALSGESILLAVRSGFERLVIDRRVGMHSLRVDWDIGSRLPLHVGGLGVALLAFAPPGIFEDLLKRERHAFTAKTLTKESALRAELERVREAGLRVSVDDYAIGEFSVAAPVLNGQREAIAAVNIAGFTARLTAEKRDAYGTAVREAAMGITAALEGSSQN